MQRGSGQAECKKQRGMRLPRLRFVHRPFLSTKRVPISLRDSTALRKPGLMWRGLLGESLSLAIQEKNEQVRNLVNLGKERGYLLHDEVIELLPVEQHATEEIDKLFSTLERESIEIYEDLAAAKAAHPAVLVTGYPVADREEAVHSEEAEVYPAPRPADISNDPVRIYLREMGVTSLLTREREVVIAKRIERGQLLVLKAISRSPIVLKELLATGAGLRNGTRRIIDRIEKLYAVGLKQATRLENTARSNKRAYLLARGRVGRTRVMLSRM